MRDFGLTIGLLLSLLAAPIHAKNEPLIPSVGMPTQADAETPFANDPLLQPSPELDASPPDPIRAKNDPLILTIGKPTQADEKPQERSPTGAPAIQAPPAVGSQLTAQTDAKSNPLVLTIVRPGPADLNSPNCPPANLPAPQVAPSPPADPTQPPVPNSPSTNQVAAATEAGTQPGAMFNPNIFGDLFGISGRQLVTVPGQFSVTTLTIPGSTATTTSSTVSTGNAAQPGLPTTTTTSTTTTAPSNSLLVVREPAKVATQGIPIFGQYNGFKITDNESPRPVDRIFATYNYFNEINRSLIPAAIPTINASRQLFGFEKTFLQGDASLGMRLPYIQYYGFSDVQSQSIGDLSVLFKFAWVNDRQTGNVVSSGLVVTTPTGPNQVFLADGSLAPHSTLFQPWAGAIYNFREMFVQGFTSIVVPSNQRDPTIFFKSLGAGWWLYRSNDDRLLSAFVPVAELHLNTPLNHRSPSDTIYVQDQLNMTVGAYTMLRRLTIGTAVGTPLFGPRPFHVEAIVSANMRF